MGPSRKYQGRRRTAAMRSSRTYLEEKWGHFPFNSNAIRLLFQTSHPLLAIRENAGSAQAWLFRPGAFVHWTTYGLHVSKLCKIHSDGTSAWFQQADDEWAVALRAAFRQVLQASLPNDTEKKAEVGPSIRRPALITIYRRITPSSGNAGLHLSFTHPELALHFLLLVTWWPRSICFPSPLYSHPSSYLWTQLAFYLTAHPELLALSLCDVLLVTITLKHC